MIKSVLTRSEGAGQVYPEIDTDCCDKRSGKEGFIFKTNQQTSLACTTVSKEHHLSNSTSHGVRKK